MFSSIDALRSQLGASETTAAQKAYAEKMMHPLPVAETVDRVKFILERVTGKCVLEFGATGPLHDAAVKVATRVYGFDRPVAERPAPYAIENGVEAFDLDDVSQPDLPMRPWPQPSSEPGVEIVLCGEVLEHLSNPGWFLTRLKRQYPGVPVIVTVPNAFTDIARRHLARGYENVNGDHCAWYSPKTLRVLLERAGYEIGEFYYYGAGGPTSEGLIAVTE